MSTEQKTVKMTRDESQFPAPHEADVHPDEVANYSAAGWVEAEASQGQTGTGSGEPAAMTVSAIREALTAKGVAFDPAAKKADLLALLQAQPA